MTLTAFNNKTDRSTDYRIFLDGNVLVATLPAVVDLALYTSLYRNLGEAADGDVRQILLDCSAVEKLCASGIAAFISLGRLTREQCLRLLILDPPVGISRQLDPLLPHATWVDSYTQAGAAESPRREMVA